MAKKSLKERKDIIDGLIKSTENQVEKFTEAMNSMEDKTSYEFTELAECVERASKNLCALKNMKMDIEWQIEDEMRDR